VAQWLLLAQLHSQQLIKDYSTINYGLVLIMVKPQNISQITAHGHQVLYKQPLQVQSQTAAIQHTQMLQ
jgi:hypothetical protein